MYQRTYLPLLALVAIFTLTGLSACDDINQPDNGDQGQQQVETTSQEVSEADASAARDFWTSNRMLEATPADPGWESHEGEDPPPSSTPEVPGPGVEMVQQAGSAPETASGNVAAELSQLAGRIMAKDSMIYGASQVGTSYTQYPFRAVGRVFFTKDDNWRSCSGAVIASENRSVVWTAGHCVADGGNEDWHNRWVFVPAYKDGNAPLGQWSARVKTTFVAWYSNGNRNYDLGAVVVEQRDNQNIASVTGSLGWMFNAQRSQDWRELGYPGSGSLFSGQKMWQCFAPYDGADGVGSNSGPRTSQITSCDMTGGASGGPWVVNFENCPSCYINSATSWGWWQQGHSNINTKLAGPYHGSAAQSLLQFAEGF